MRSKTLFLLPAAFIGLYFFQSAGLGLKADFTQDDLMNMYGGMVRPYPSLVREILFAWLPAPSYRPFGSLVYKISLDLYGLNLSALSLLRYATLCANLVLLYALGRRLSGSRETGVLAALLFAYHVNQSPLYYNTGTLYDIFCYFFFFAALLYYVRIRQSGRFPGWPELAGFYALFTLALASKEMALALPFILGAYEVLYHPPPSIAPKRLVRWAYQASAAPLLAAGMALACYLGRIEAKNGVASVGLYKADVSVAVYLNRTGHYLAEVFMKADTAWAAGITVAFLLLCLGLALALRSRVMVFSVLLFVMGILPVAFIPWRGLNAVYIPLAGLAIFAAALLVAVRDVVVRGVSLLFRRAAGREAAQAPVQGFSTGNILLFVLVAAFLLQVQPESSAAYDAWQRDVYGSIRSVMNQMPVLHPKVTPRDRILIVNDPFEPQFNYASLFIARMVYRDESLVVDRLADMQPKPTAAEIAKYNILLGYQDGKLRDLSPAEAAAAAAR